MTTYIAKTAWVGDSARVYGSAWVGDSARVYGSARVGDSAVICGDGRVSKPGDYLTLGPAISSGGTTTLHRDAKIRWRVNRGCFSGTVDEFEAAIHATHKDNVIAHAQYVMFLAVIRGHIRIMDARP